VIRYAENSLNNRNLIMGKCPPSGLNSYIRIIKREQPDLIHFHEIAGGRGIGIYHVNYLYRIGIKTVITFHLSTYSCQTGNLVYKDKVLCVGIIDYFRCSACSFHSKGIGRKKSKFLDIFSKYLFKLNVNVGRLNNSLGTALSYPFIISKKKFDLINISKEVNKIIVLTKWYKNILEINGVSTEKIIHISQGVTGNIVNINNRLSDLPVRIVFIGRVSKYKGLHHLLEAMHGLPNEKIQLDIYGPVTEDEYGILCKKMTQGVENIFWKGELSNENVIETLSGYDLLCLPSTFSEMSPLVIQEAFAAGIPVLASNVYGNAEQIKDGINGWLFEFKNSDSLRNKLKMLTENIHLIDFAKKNMPSVKSFDTIADEHMAIYHEIINITYP
jgi:glycosyltransferase involved in cell wall biosynthesis